MIIPEYKIELLNKSKKIIDTVEYLNNINKNLDIDQKEKKEKSNKFKEQNKINLKKSKKNKVIKKKSKNLRTLWVRRKKKN